MAKVVGNHQGVFDSSAARDIIDTNPLAGPIQSLVGSADLISLKSSVVPAQNYVINSTGVDAIVLPDPTAGADDGLCVLFQDGGGHAHTITSSGSKFKSHSASVAVATMDGTSAALLSLRAYNGFWYVLAAIGITFS